MRDFISVLKLVPNKTPKIVKIENTISSFAKIVDGSFEFFKDGNCFVVYNENAKTLNKPKNIIIGDRQFYGTVFLCVNTKGDFASMTRQTVSRYVGFESKLVREINARRPRRKVVMVCID